MAPNSRLGWAKIQEWYETVHPNLSLVLLFVLTEVECTKGLFGIFAVVTWPAVNLYVFGKTDFGFGVRDVFCACKRLHAEVSSSGWPL